MRDFEFFRRFGSASPSAHVLPTQSSPLICFSHLRWDFVTQRPQHLMRRFAQSRRVFVWEEHISCDHHLPYVEHHPFPSDGVIALRPRIPRGWSRDEVGQALRQLLDTFVATSVRGTPLLWFYTPMMFDFAEHLDASAVVYDCMDELSAFRFADPELLEREARLLDRADLVFTGGFSLYEAKRDRHPDVHLFPSAVDVDHFARARGGLEAPADQRDISGPRLGYYGVIDERLDLPLIAELADRRPDWSLVMVGPVVKIDADELPQRANLHWLGAREYADLPAFLAEWDVALMPFAINEATRFISPTKTPEYLAGGVPVVSTPILDVVRTYGQIEAVGIASDAASFIAACEAALALPRTGAWRDQADRLLASQSWDNTQAAMMANIERVFASRSPMASEERHVAVL